MASIVIIGSGFVGQANGKVLARQGHRVLFVDIDDAKLSKLREEGYHTTNYEQFPRDLHVDVFFVSVPTPTVDGQIKLDHIKKAAQDLGGLLSRYDTHPIVVVKSTVPPGTTNELIIPLLEKYSTKKEGRDFGVAFEPEYLREATSLQDAERPRVITIGSRDVHTAAVVAWLRAPFHCPIKQVKTEEAEMQKYVHNIFNATKITFFNEMREICRKLNLNDGQIFEITADSAEASWNTRYGIRDFGPFDGSCLPKDTAAFLHFAKEKLQTDMTLLSTVIDVNKRLQEEQSQASINSQKTL